MERKADAHHMRVHKAWVHSWLAEWFAQLVVKASMAVRSTESHSSEVGWCGWGTSGAASRPGALPLSAPRARSLLLPGAWSDSWEPTLAARARAQRWWIRGEPPARAASVSSNSGSSWYRNYIPEETVQWKCGHVESKLICILYKSPLSKIQEN